MPINNFPEPYLISFKAFGDDVEGYISVAEWEKEIPFVFKRVFWTYGTPKEIIRGGHFHLETQQVLIAVNGKITVHTETKIGGKKTFVLANPFSGIYIPPNAWHTMEYESGSVQLVFASTNYDESDYIHDYEQLKSS